jgi:triosephosphate isomerase
LGAQNVFYKETGAFTGEVSPAQLVDLGIKYVIVGHSERRQLGETNYIINKKIKAALEFRLKPILCVGEKENEDKNLILTQQITEGLKNVSNFKFQISNLVVAYEPVWAIGTGKNCSVEETMVSVLTIKKIISKLYNKNLAEKIKVLYGGSVNSKNSGIYLKEARVNGLLVGGNSLDGSEFIKIVKQAKI